MFEQIRSTIDADEEWYDATILGSAYEVQISRSGKFRHRPLSFNVDHRRDPFAERGIGEWHEGRAP